MVQSGWKYRIGLFVSRWTKHSLLALSAISITCAPLSFAAEDDEPLDGDEVQEEPAKPKGPPKPYVVPNAEQTRFSVIADQADPREVLELKANNESVLALYRPEHSPKARGALVILHEEEGHPDWPMVVNPVRTQMPDFGWATLSVAIPGPGSIDLPERTMPAVEVLTRLHENDEEEAAAEEGVEGDGIEGEEGDLAEEAAQESIAQDEEGDELGDEDEDDSNSKAEWPPVKPTFVETEDFGPLSDRIDARIDAAVAHLLAQGYEQIIFVGHGVGAVWLMDYLKDHPAPPEQAVVMIQTRLPNHDIGVDLMGLILEQQRPILDLYYDDNRFDKAFAVERSNAARRSGNPHYRQTRLGGLGMQTGQSEAKGRRIVQSLRGWLDYLYQFEGGQKDPADSYIKGPIRSLYEERMERSRY
ncbi:DUF3530 family protein [Oceanospirillum maris]|uniref:DUF3530 family protein n=1 Tax=Oceanospirillum maris TaxID=64977 RepID=UPI000408513A|nr:DUF3530 family protein [Oceanospirillum maris]